MERMTLTGILKNLGSVVDVRKTEQRQPPLEGVWDPAKLSRPSRLPPLLSSLQRLIKNINNYEHINTENTISQRVNKFTMARRRYTSYVAPQSDSSDAEDHIFVGSKDEIQAGVRKRVGDIRFWPEDRENRRERPRVNACASKSDHNTRIENPTPASVHSKAKRRHTTTPRQILSHIESKPSYMLPLSAVH